MPAPLPSILTQLPIATHLRRAPEHESFDAAANRVWHKHMNERADRLRDEIEFFRAIIDRTRDHENPAIPEAATTLLNERLDELSQLEQAHSPEEARGDAAG